VLTGGPDDARPDVRGRNATLTRLASAPGQAVAFDFPGYATDGRDGNTTFPVDIRPANDSQRTGFTFVFPASNAIYYDPVVTQDTDLTAAEIAALSATSNTTTTTPSPAATTTQASSADQAFTAGCRGLYVLAASLCTLLVYV
jgi:hypothetical protein